MPKISRPPSVSTLIDRHSRALAALRNRLLIERDTNKLLELHTLIGIKSAHLDKLRAEQRS
jgi:hypothetical protein